MIIEGRGVLIMEANVNTDVLYPGAYLNIDDPQQMKQHLFEGYDPTLRDEMGEDTVLVTGSNFGIGSSREHPPLAMKASGVRCVLGESFARIFRRNCINLGLPVIECVEAAEAARPGSNIRIDTGTGQVAVDGRTFHAQPIPDFILELQAAGGLVDWARARAAGRPDVPQPAG